ncbi:PREDICTED: band 7 protein AGAP004871-like [Habropoda laboriosa]|uniref:band 7 protein AGAP004871-like n=1 Tax=Habropoda laboriosa TaxID=597456 RepID=UPI00083E19A9|nr:PREDICTED: band 7 protein AGAP004871-like [Habropoda laboriosa]
MVHYGCAKTDSGGVECFVEFSETPQESPMKGMAEERKVGAMTRFVELLATVGSFLLVLVTLPFSLCFTFKVVQEYERAVVFRMGRLKGGAYGPGKHRAISFLFIPKRAVSRRPDDNCPRLCVHEDEGCTILKRLDGGKQGVRCFVTGTFFVMPCVDYCVRVDLRTVSFDVPPQEVLTKDSVTVSVDAVVYYRIKEPLNAVVKIANYSHSTRLLAASTLRTVLGTRNLAEILSERETISHTMQTSLDEATDPWGVKVERVEIKDVRLPVQLQRAMATEAEATREARAKVIAAEGEMLASRALKEASDVISMSPAALQLRYLQTLSNISVEKNSTIIFPLPVEFLAPFFSGNFHPSSKSKEALGTSSEKLATGKQFKIQPDVHLNVDSVKITPK